MKRSRRLALACIVLAASAFTATATGMFESESGWIAGSGVLRTENRTVPAFSQIVVEGSGDVALRQGLAQSLSVEADDNVLPAVKTEVIGGVLHLGFKDGTHVSGMRRLEFRITAVRIEGITISGSGSVHGKSTLASGSMRLDIGGSGSIDTELDTARLDAGISGSGSIAVNGHADRLAVTINGSGGFSGRELKCADAEVHINGSGDAAVMATDTIDITIAGSGSVTYGGGAKATIQSTGSGRVRQE
jgi:hypothetical protein